MLKIIFYGINQKLDLIFVLKIIFYEMPFGNQKLDLIFVLKIIFYEMNQKLDLILESKLDLIFVLKNIFYEMNQSWI